VTGEIEKHPFRINIRVRAKTPRNNEYVLGDGRVGREEFVGYRHKSTAGNDVGARYK